MRARAAFAPQIVPERDGYLNANSGPSKLVTFGRQKPYFFLLACCAPLLLALSHGEFFWTDTVEIGDQGTVFSSWSSLVRAVAHGVQGQYYRPTVFVLNSINNWLLGDAPLAYRTCNLFLHVSNVVLVFALLNRWVDTRKLAFPVAALFAVHPLCVSGINWVADRTDLASFFFCLVSLHTALTYVRAGRRVIGLSAICAFTLAVAAKETASAIAVVTAAAGVLSRGKSRARTFTFLGGQLLVVVLALAWHSRVYGNEWVRPHSLNVASRLALGIQIHLEYVAQLSLPHTLTVCDAERVPHLMEPAVLGGLLLFTLLAVVVIRKRQQLDRVQAWSLLWVITFALPTSGVIQLAHVRADRYLYFLLPAAILLVARTAQRSLHASFGARSRVIEGALVAGCYAYFACIVAVRAHHFTSEEALWSHELHQNELCLEAHSYMARKATMAGSLDLAEAELKLALREPAGFVAYVDRWGTEFYSARLLLDRGRLSEGNALMNDIVDRAPSGALRGEAAYALAISELISGNLSMVEHNLTLAASLDLSANSRRDVLLLRSYARLKLGRFDDCAADFRRYLALSREQPSGFRRTMMQEIRQALSKPGKTEPNSCPGSPK